MTPAPPNGPGGRPRPAAAVPPRATPSVARRDDPWGVARPTRPGTGRGPDPGLGHAAARPAVAPLPGRRVVVTSPRTEAGRRGRPVRRRRRDELADQTGVGEVLIRSLMRAQLGLALRVLAVVVVLLGGAPLLLALVPAAGDAEVGGVRALWLLLGVAAFPLLVLLGLVYTRQAERHEREFAELVEY
ncbi:MAG TPA: hypothetical protein VIL36_12140 [Acidimicrobiales bacterium]